MFPSDTCSVTYAYIWQKCLSLILFPSSLHSLLIYVSGVLEQRLRAENKQTKFILRKHINETSNVQLRLIELTLKFLEMNE